MQISIPIALLLLFIASGGVFASGLQDEEFFESKIRPVLIERCYDCHNEDSAESELRLDSLQGMRKGGNRGPAIIPGDAEASLLIRAIQHDGRLQMPPKEKLPATHIADLVTWIQRGAIWPNAKVVENTTVASEEFAISDEDKEFWAFVPPVRPPIPSTRDGDWASNEIDAFLLSRMESVPVRPASPAKKETLLRRATFDLTGLPPTPGEIKAYVDDDSSDAFTKVIDRLLASPRYGERWGRHWLDVARYADSNGLDENLAYGNAFRYRDYVIRAFNADKPFDRFLGEQIAGDLLYPYQEVLSADSRDAVVATGFLSLGAKMLAEDDPVKMQMDIIDEQVDTIGRAFMGLTLGCARCHDHKFDPIPTADYYSLAGIFKSTHTMEHFRVVARWQERPLKTKELAEEIREYESKLADFSVLEKQTIKKATSRIQAEARRHLGAYLLAAFHVNQLLAGFENGDPLHDEASEETIIREAEDFDRGNVQKDKETYGKEIGVLVNRGELPNFAEYDFELQEETACMIRFRYAAAESRPCHLSVNGIIVNNAACTKTTGGWYPDQQRWHFEAICQLNKGRNTIRIEQPKFFPHIDQFAIHPLPLSTIIAHQPQTWDWIPLLVNQWANFLKADKSNKDSIFKEFHPSQTADSANLSTLKRVALAISANAQDPILQKLIHDPNGPFGISDARGLESKFSQQEQASLATIRKQIKLHESQKPTIPMAMAVSDVAKPHNLRVHLRGSHLTQGSEVPRRFPRIIPISNAPQKIPDERSGRLELARWLTDPGHPLTARVIVNRIWQGHFGTGLVRTPDNFGQLGKRPTHPQLLDWLAVRLIEEKWSIKWLHRLIMNSSAYRMSIEVDPAVLQRDPENKLYSHANRRRLEAEAIRDSLMAVSDTLDLRMGGTQLPTANRSYVTSTANVNPNVYKGQRRSIYLPVVRSAVFQVLQAFDFPDPAVINGKRQATTVAPQSLFMMNSEFVEAQSKSFATVVLSSSSDRVERVHDAYIRAFGRKATKQEIRATHNYLESAMDLLEQVDVADREQIAYQSWCRALMGSNEFIYLE